MPKGMLVLLMVLGMLAGVGVYDLVSPHKQVIEVHVGPSQELIGRAIVMAANGWSEWPQYPACHYEGLQFFNLPCLLGNELFTEQPRFKVIDPAFQEKPTEWPL